MASKSEVSSQGTEIRIQDQVGKTSISKVMEEWSSVGIILSD